MKKQLRIAAATLAAALITAVLPVQASAADTGLALSARILNPEAMQQGQPMSIQLTATKDGTAVSGNFPVTISGYGGYSRDGLMLWYDAIDNQGSGTQSSNATQWRDLSGHGNNGALQNTTQWQANSLLLPGYSYRTNGRVHTPAMSIPANYSLEICYDTSQNRTPTNSIALASATNDTNQFLSIDPNNAYLRFGAPLGKAVPVNKSNLLTGSTSLVVSDMNNGIGTKALYSGGLPITTPYSEAAYLPISSGLYIGYSSGGGTNVNDIAYHSVRLYNRALTQDEMKGNYSYDKLRFGLTTEDRLPSPAYDPKIGTLAGKSLSYTGSTTLENVEFINGVATLPLTLNHGGIYNLRFEVTVQGETVWGDLGDTGISSGANAPKFISIKVEKQENGVYTTIGGDGTTEAAAVNYGNSGTPRLSAMLVNTTNVSYQWYLNDLPSRLTAAPIAGATNATLSPQNLPHGVSYLYCAASKTVSGVVETSYSPMVAVRIGYGGTMSIGANHAPGISGLPLTKVYVYEYSTMTTPDGTTQKVGSYYPTLPQNFISATRENLLASSFYQTTVGLGTYFTTAGLSAVPPVLPIPRVGIDGSMNLPYLEGKDANGNYNFPPSTTGQMGGIPVPNWSGTVPPPPGPISIEQTATAGMRLSLPALPAPLTPPTAYTVAADKINLEFGAVNPTTAVNVTTPNGSSVYSGMLTSRVVTLNYDYRTPLLVTQQTGTGELLETPLDLMSLRRTVMAAGDHWYYLADGELRGDIGIIPGDFIHLFGGQALDSNGCLHSLEDDMVVGSPVTVGAAEMVLPLHTGQLDGAQLDCFGGYTAVTTADGSVTLRDGQLTVEDGQLFAVDSALLLNPDGTLVDSLLGLDYSTVLARDGSLYHLMEPLKLPKNANTKNIAHISSGGSQPVLLVRYNNGGAAGWNYLTGEALPIEYLPDDLSFLEFMEGYFDAKPLAPGAITGYPEIKKLNEKLSVYPNDDDSPLGSLLRGETTEELISGDHKPQSGTAAVVGDNRQPVDGTADADRADPLQQVRDEGQQPEENPNNPDTKKKEPNNAPETAGGDTGKVQDGSDAPADPSDSREGAEATAFADSATRPSANHTAYTRSYISYYNSTSGEYELYDRDALMTQPQDLLQPVNKLLQEQGLLDSPIPTELPTHKEPTPGVSGLLLFVLTSLAVVALLIYLHGRKSHGR